MVDHTLLLNKKRKKKSLFWNGLWGPWWNPLCVRNKLIFEVLSPSSNKWLRNSRPPFISLYLARGMCNVGVVFFSRVSKQQQYRKQSACSANIYPRGNTTNNNGNNHSWKPEDTILFSISSRDYLNGNTVLHRYWVSKRISSSSSSYWRVAVDKKKIINL